MVTIEIKDVRIESIVQNLGMDRVTKEFVDFLLHSVPSRKPATSTPLTLDERIRQQRGDEKSAQASKEVETALSGLCRLADPEKRMMSLPKAREDYYRQI